MREDIRANEVTENRDLLQNDSSERETREREKQEKRDKREKREKRERKTNELVVIISRASCKKDLPKRKEPTVQ